MKKTMFYYIIIIASLFACTSNRKEQISYNYTLTWEEKPTKKIYIGSNNSPTSNCMQLIQHKEQLLLAYQSRGQISFFDLSNGELIHKIKYERDGPNSIEGLRSFYFVDFDTIYTFSGMPWYFFHTDSAGKVINKIEIPYLDVDGVTACINADFYHIHQRIIRIDNKIHLPTYLYDINLQNCISQYSTGIIYDLVSDTAVFSNIKYPKIAPSQYHFSREYGNGSWVYSFNYSNGLYLWNNKNEEFTYLDIKNSNAPKTIPKLQLYPDMHQSLYHSVTSPRYSSLLYDEWRDLYYWIYYPGIKVDKNTETQHLYSMIENIQQFEVTILNNNLQIIGETRMPENRFNPEMYLINESGLHFAYHINHPEFDPDYLKFARFTVEPINQ